MPGREVILATNQIYHLFNKGVSSQDIFLRKKDYQRALDTLAYYQNINLSCRYSYFIVQSQDIKNKILKELQKKNKLLVEILAYCLLPNHFHLLVKQKVDNGISTFMGNFSNSYTRYFNTKNKRGGHLFQGKFKAVRIVSDEQLTHVSRYIHLNPYTSYLVRKVDNLITYPYSSFSEYLTKTGKRLSQKNLVLGLFKNKVMNYQKFVFNQADYQRKLSRIKHSILE